MAKFELAIPLALLEICRLVEVEGWGPAASGLLNSRKEIALDGAAHPPLYPVVVAPWLLLVGEMRILRYRTGSADLCRTSIFEASALPA